MPPATAVWARCARAEHAPMMATIAAQLAEDGDQIEIVTTQRTHPTGRRDVRDFLVKHRPIMVFQLGGALDATTHQQAEAAGIPLVLVDPDDTTLSSVGTGWFPRKNKGLLANFQDIFAPNSTLAAALVDAGARADRVHVIGPFEPSVPVLRYSEAERQDIAGALLNRPVWLARSVAPEDIPMLATAQRHGARRSHRLLLIIAPDDPHNGAAMAQDLRNKGFVVASRSIGQDIDESTQIYIADFGGEDGLWLRIAPICFAGGSLTTGALNDPFEAAALGSVVIHGGATGPYEPRFHRLARAGASCAISGSDKLGHAVEALLSADRVAQMATAGWDVTSSGAEMTNRLVALIQNQLDGVPG